MALDDISDLWWLKDRPEESQAGFALGVNMAIQQGHNRLLQQQQQSLMAVRGYQMLMDAAKLRDAEARSRGMADISSFLSTVASKNAWLDPQAKSEFWARISNWPILINDNSATTLYRNTFGAAELADEKRKGVIGTAAVTNEAAIHNFEQLAKVAESEGDTEGAAALLRRAKTVRFGAGMAIPEAGGMPIETVMVEGRPMHFYQDRLGNRHLIKMPDFEKMPPEETAMMRAEFKAVEARQIAGEFDDPKTHNLDTAKYQAALEAVYNKHAHRGKAAAPEAPQPLYQDFLDFQKNKQ